MIERSKIAVFDFDGTITKHDTLILFILYSKGYLSFMFGLLLNSIKLIKYKLGYISNNDAKEQLFSYFFGGMEYSVFKKYGEEFVKVIKKDVRPLALHEIHKMKNDQISMYIVSASVKEWIEPWAKDIGFKLVISTEIEVDSKGLLTGRFSTPNCYGEEKVNRLRTMIPENTYIIGFGDSNGDKELLEYANEAYMKQFH